MSSLKGRRVEVFLKHPVIKPGGVVDKVSGICVMDGRSEIKIISDKELLTIQKRNIIMIKTPVENEDLLADSEFSYD